MESTICLTLNYRDIRNIDKLLYTPYNTSADSAIVRLALYYLLEKEENQNKMSLCKKIREVVRPESGNGRVRVFLTDEEAELLLLSCIGGHDAYEKVVQTAMSEYKKMLDVPETIEKWNAYKGLDSGRYILDDTKVFVGDDVKLDLGYKLIYDLYAQAIKADFGIDVYTMSGEESEAIETKHIVNYGRMILNDYNDGKISLSMAVRDNAVCGVICQFDENNEKERKIQEIIKEIETKYGFKTCHIIRTPAINTPDDGLHAYHLIACPETEEELEWYKKTGLLRIVSFEETIYGFGKNAFDTVEDILDFVDVHSYLAPVVAMYSGLVMPV